MFVYLLDLKKYGKYSIADVDEENIHSHECWKYNPPAIQFAMRRDGDDTELFYKYKF